jgi:23S rRNA (uracil1939-C5)-methyltransferase
MAEELALDLEDMAHGGDAVGRHQGKVVFVPFGIPGESVRVAITRDSKRFAHARLLEVLSPSPQRVSPPCPYFGTCGGCQWQHIRYETQLDYKRSIVQAQLQRIAGIGDAAVKATIGMSEPWHYRNHAQFSVSHDGQLGFMASGSHRVVPIERCLLMLPLLEEMYEALDVELTGLARLTLRAGIGTGDQMIVFEMDADQLPELEVEIPVSCVALWPDGTAITLIGSGHIMERLAGHTFRVSASSFFQVNTHQTEQLVSVVSAYLSPSPDDVLVDAYCGVGTFGVALAAQVAQVIGIENNAASSADAQANAADQANSTFIEGPAEKVLPTLQNLESPLVVLDPPRTGLASEALSAVVDLAPARIVYVSCDPATLARDVGKFVASGYDLHAVQPIDMFPQTYHIECVALLLPTGQEQARSSAEV